MNIKVDLIPKGRKRRPGIKNTIKYITIHNTGLKNVPADNFRRSCLDPSQDQEVSWHYTVDEKEIVQHIPDNEVAWHAGNRTGNYESIGIEICERDGAEQKAIELIIYLMEKYNIPISNIKSHKDFSGKYCPHLILPRWNEFIKQIEIEFNKNETIKICINGKIKECQCIIKDNFTYVKLRDLSDGQKIIVDYKNGMATLNTK